MTRNVWLLAVTIALLSACTTPPQQRATSVLDELDQPRFAANSDCARPPLGKVCITVVESVKSDAKCSCIDQSQVPTLATWPTHADNQ